MKNRELQPRLLYPAKLSFRIEGQIKNFPDKKKLKEFIIIKPLLYGTIFFRDLFKKKKKVKTLNNKMAIIESKNLSTIESKIQTTKIRTKTESWIWRVF